MERECSRDVMPSSKLPIPLEKLVSVVRTIPGLEVRAPLLYFHNMKKALNHLTGQNWYKY